MVVPPLPPSPDVLSSRQEKKRKKRSSIDINRSRKKKNWVRRRKRTSILVELIFFQYFFLNFKYFYLHFLVGRVSSWMLSRITSRSSSSLHYLIQPSLYLLLFFHHHVFEFSSHHSWPSMWCFCRPIRIALFIATRYIAAIVELK